MSERGGNDVTERGRCLEQYYQSKLPLWQPGMVEDLWHSFVSDNSLNGRDKSTCMCYQF